MDRLTSLELFARVIETGSLSRAAADLGISQPTATKQIAALEARLGHPLLNRSSRGVTPTEVGALYYEQCRVVVGALQATEDLPTLVKSQMSGVLRVAAPPTFGRRVLAPHALRFMQQFPSLTLDLHVGEEPVSLADHQFDLAIRFSAANADKHAISLISTSPWTIVGATSHLERYGIPACLDDLLKQPCLIDTHLHPEGRWLIAQPDSDAVPVVVKGPFRTNDIEMLYQAAKAGLGLAILPWYMVTQDVADGLMRPVLQDHGLNTHAIQAVRPPGAWMPAIVQAYIDDLKRELSGSWWLRSSRIAAHQAGSG